MDPIEFDEVNQEKYQDLLNTISTYQLKVLQPKKVRYQQTPTGIEFNPLVSLFRTPDRYSLVPKRLLHI